LGRYSLDGLEKIRLANLTRFLNDAHEKFGNKFDYSRVVYQRQKIPVLIVCPMHNEFSITPDRHLQSDYGCPKCGVLARATKRISDGESRFIKNFRLKFSDNLELLSPYISSHSQILCRCKLHGIDFETTPNRLDTWKHGCPKCARDATALSSALSQAEFMQRVIEKFGTQFDFSKSSYHGMQEKVRVVCPIHGDFLVTPISFLQSSHGCRQCSKLYMGYAENRINKLEQGLVKSKPTHIALMKIEVYGIESFKLGISSRDLIARYRESLREIIFDTTLDELDALKLEQSLHAKYFKWRDLRIFLAGLRSGKRWSGDSEIYQEECIPNILAELNDAVSALESKDANYWNRFSELKPPILTIRSVRKVKGIYNKSKQVIRFDTKEIYPSATAAANSIGSTQALVSMVCTGKRGHTKGVRFAYLEDFKSNTVPVFIDHQKGKNNPKAKAVRCINTGVIYPTISNASSETGLHSGKIVAVCKGIRKSTGGLNWEYVKDGN